MLQGETLQGDMLHWEKCYGGEMCQGETLQGELFLGDLSSGRNGIHPHTFIPQGSVAVSKFSKISVAMVSRSDKISAKLLVPRMVLKVVEANNLVLLS